MNFLNDGFMADMFREEFLYQRASEIYFTLSIGLSFMYERNFNFYEKKIVKRGDSSD